MDTQKEGGRSPTGPVDWGFLLVWILLGYADIWAPHVSQVYQVIGGRWALAVHRVLGRRIEPPRVSSEGHTLFWIYAVAWAVVRGFVVAGGWLLMRSPQSAFSGGSATVHHPYTYAVLLTVVALLLWRVHDAVYFSLRWSVFALVLRLAMLVVVATAAKYASDVSDDPNRHWLPAALLVWIGFELIFLPLQALAEISLYNDAAFEPQSELRWSGVFMRLADKDE